jgi:hypothetical protein
MRTLGDEERSAMRTVGDEERSAMRASPLIPSPKLFIRGAGRLSEGLAHSLHGL